MRVATALTERIAMRNVWLDRLRAIAVLTVIAFHVVQMSPVPQPWLMAVTQYGHHGVDLFFVLSGWLVGGLYWREHRTFGNVAIATFWLRRWMRTIPPYLAALVLSWLAVRVARGERFDPGYLIFAQNYYERIPFFLVSWSLCIEEHFYLLAPLVVGGAIALLGHHRLWIAFLALVLFSPLARWVEYPDSTSIPFGYALTATHLRLDGLVLGFAASHLYVHKARMLERLRQYLFLAILVWGASLILLELQGGRTSYVMTPLVLSIGLCWIVAALGSAHEGRTYQSSSTIRSIALASYSAYLMHPLAIHASTRLAAHAPIDAGLAYWPLVVAAIVAATSLFYAAVERPSIEIRDAITPRRQVVGLA